MRDDSEKVPALLTDYILKGKHTHTLSEQVREKKEIHISYLNVFFIIWINIRT